MMRQWTPLLTNVTELQILGHYTNDLVDISTIIMMTIPAEPLYIPNPVQYFAWTC